MKKVCVVTATRAEYGLLKPLIKRIDYDNELKLQLVVTGMHLVHEYGYTYNHILKDDFKITEKVEILLNSDTPVAISKSMGLAMISFSEVFERIKPDMVIVLGDRYEIFAVASAAMIANIPIAHIHGGEVTEGAIDEAIRHSITKMSYIHFTSTEEYRKRVIQLGENPRRVFNTGALGAEVIKNMKFMDKSTLEEEIGMKFDNNVALLTFHPVTLEGNSVEAQFREVLDAVDEFDNLNIIFTKANSDTNGHIINELIDKYVSLNPDKSIAFAAMGQLKYLSAMKYCSFVIGNSSSGIFETPIMKKPTINIGDRQKGRIQTESIINCNPKREEIVKSIKLALSSEFNENIAESVSPYGNGNVSEEIVREIKNMLLKKEISLKKEFYNLKIDYSEAMGD
ncbi:UDP-N-acetylglucosamine 2-epimerase [Clostridium butyricum]|uniref:UDP-N-acetylglucosamine 2-epimerase n=1 Tax=Clostridium butyricum TaxID=1492 RepID=UPI00374E3710